MTFAVLGSNATVLPSVEIGSNVIIGVGTVVAKNIADNCLVIGLPGEVNKQLEALNFDGLMDNKLTVSVCMITYKHEEFISSAISGVLMQKVNFNIEFIIADDHSPDKTEFLVKEFISQHSNGTWIKYTKHPYNFGMIDNFLYALKSCEGKFIAFCEGDDYWTDPFKLQKQVDFLEHNPAYSMCGHLVKVLKNGNFESDSFAPGTFGIDHVISQGRCCQTASLVFRNFFKSDKREWLNFVLTNEIISGDRLLQLIGGHAGKINVLPEHMAVYRKHADGIMQTRKYQQSHDLAMNGLLKSFDIATGKVYSELIKHARLNWLKTIFQKDISISNKVTALVQILDINYSLGLKCALTFPYYWLKAKVFQILRN